MLLQAISILKQLGWEKFSALPRLHAKLEAMRIAWADRDRFYGDPEKVEVPIARLLSADYAKEMADKVNVALENKKPVPLVLDSNNGRGNDQHFSRGQKRKYDRDHVDSWQQLWRACFGGGIRLSARPRDVAI